MGENDELKDYVDDELQSEYNFRLSNYFILGFIGIVLLILGTRIGCSLFGNRLSMESGNKFYSRRLFFNGW